MELDGSLAVGDIQGCFGNLERLLKLINFNQKRDYIMGSW